MRCSVRRLVHLGSVIAALSATAPLSAQDLYDCTGPCAPEIEPGLCSTDNTPVQAVDHEAFSSDFGGTLNRELNDWATFYLDARQGGFWCGRLAASRFNQKLKNTLDAYGHTAGAGPWHVIDPKQGYTPVHLFRTWLSGGLITHIFAAAKEFDFKNLVPPEIAAELATSLSEVRAIFRDIASPQDRGCGLDSLPNVNSCMDDHALTATGFAWIAALEKAQFRDPGAWATLAENEIRDALSPMSVRSSATRGGGPCFQSASGSSPANCDATWATYNDAADRIIGADHGQENPSYGLGLMTSIASACAGLYIADRTCAFDEHQQIVARELLVHGQETSDADGCAFERGQANIDLGGCLNFSDPTGPSRDCSDSNGFGDEAYHPADYPVALFYQRRGVPMVAGGFPFDHYCENRTSYLHPYLDAGPRGIWGPNRKVLYDLLAFEIFKPDTVPPRASLVYPKAGAVVSGNVRFAVNAADDLRIQRVEYRLVGARSLTYTTTVPPWNLELDTSAGNLDGAYTITAWAYDAAAQNIGVSDGVGFTISNPHIAASTVYPTLGIGAYGGNSFCGDLGETRRTADFICTQRGYAAGAVSFTIATKPAGSFCAYKTPADTPDSGLSGNWGHNTQIISDVTCSPCGAAVSPTTVYTTLGIGAYGGNFFCGDLGEPPRTADFVCAMKGYPRALTFSVAAKPAGSYCAYKTPASAPNAGLSGNWGHNTQVIDHIACSTCAGTILPSTVLATLGIGAYGGNYFCADVGTSEDFKRTADFICSQKGFARGAVSTITAPKPAGSFCAYKTTDDTTNAGLSGNWGHGTRVLTQVQCMP